MKIWIVICLLLAVGVQSLAQNSPHTGSGYIPQRVYDTKEKRFTDFEAMLAEISSGDVVFVGEQHDDMATHRLERAILEGLGRRRANVVVAMEMFERDVQTTLNDYLSGRINEDEFLSVSRPWPRYMTDYRPLIEFARAHKWSVVASNTPKRIASQYSKKGLEVTQGLSETDKRYIAAEIKCPMDDYFQLFSKVMSSGHPGAGGEGKQSDEMKAMIERFYVAQCVKDETMAESIANQFNSTSKENAPLVVHFNGAFHSDFRLGTASRTIRRLPNSKIKVISVIPVGNLDQIDVNEYATRGDYVVFSLKPMGERRADAR